MTQEQIDERLGQLYGPESGAERDALLKALELTNFQFNAHGVELNRRYASQAVVSDGTKPREPERDRELYHQPTTFPGSPLPHAWLATGDHSEKELSTLDVCSYEGFTLITGAGGQAWLDAAANVSSECGVEIEGVQVSLGLEVNDVYGDWIRRREIGDAGCVLVRPDRIVAFRAAEAAENPEAALRGAMMQILGK